MTIKLVIKRLALLLISLFILGFFIPQKIIVPVEHASSKDWNANSFWAYPWGKSVTHKGVDIFAKKGENVLAATGGIVVYTGQRGSGGNIVLILGPKWRFHYYAHLNDIKTTKYSFVKRGAIIGTVGDSGNAKGKPPHLHYTIATAIPYPWRIDDSPQGRRKMYFLNPIYYFNQAGY